MTGLNCPTATVRTVPDAVFPITMVAMPDSAPKQLLAAARESLTRRLDFADFLARLPAKDKVNAERRVGVLEAGPDPSRASLWRRLVCTLASLAPHAAKLVGRQTVQFYVADGKYRMQVFALEDLQDENFTVYCPDVLEEAVRAGLLAHRPQGDAQLYVVQGSGEPLRIESLDRDSLNPAAHIKDLTGWNKKALRITLPPSASPAQVQAAEMLCAIAARHFVRAAPPTDARATKPQQTPGSAGA